MANSPFLCMIKSVKLKFISQGGNMVIPQTSFLWNINKSWYLCYCKGGKCFIFGTTVTGDNSVKNAPKSSTGCADSIFLVSPRRHFTYVTIAPPKELLISFIFEIKEGVWTTVTKYRGTSRSNLGNDTYFSCSFYIYQTKVSYDNISMTSLFISPMAAWD